MSKLEPIKFYSKPEVRKEIVDYSKGRWLALLAKKDGLSLFIRYWGKTNRPLSISTEGEFLSLLGKYKNYSPRTIYATINIYHELKDKESLEFKHNIIRTTPIWDIDGDLKHWEKIIEIARIIVDSLEREGIRKSIYLKWSGRGIHVHINENAFSDDILKKYHPLDIAYAIVDYILKKNREKIMAIIKETPIGERPLKVENEIDAKRVFTVPLSIHKELDLIAVCFKPNQIDNFTPEWAKPENYKHNPDWRKYEKGEGDQLAIKAIKEVGGYFERLAEIRTVIVSPEAPKRKTTETKPRSTKVGRFQVMGLLQAARYYLLTGDIQKAKSFGLNRAIFYAWAKHYRAKVPKKRRIYYGVEHVEDKETGRKMVYVGNEGAYISEKGWFIMGDKEQRPEDFDKNIAQKIEIIMPFEKAWKAAIEYLKQFPKNVLLDQRRFYEEVYKPVRDNFFDLVLKGKIPRKTLFDLT